MVVNVPEAVNLEVTCRGGFVALVGLKFMCETRNHVTQSNLKPAAMEGR